MASVLDVGCFSAHLVVVDQDLRHPALSHKTRLRLDRAIDSSGRISAAGVAEICDAVLAARKVVRRNEIGAVVPFATSSVRDAPNASRVLKRIERRTGVRLKVLSGKEEARLAYLAARHWFQPDERMLVLDVGGGTVELAYGSSSAPDFICSLPLGARTLTMSGLSVPDMRSLVHARLASVSFPAAARAVACSKVFTQLARLTGGRVVRADDLAWWIPRLAKLSVRERASLPGISRHRARQSLAGAVVAEALMRASGHEVVEISPWSTKEGLLISLMERLPVSLSAA